VVQGLAIPRDAQYSIVNYGSGGGGREGKAGATAPLAIRTFSKF